MKLTVESLEFQRQLRKAKRLSLLEYAASERRKQLSIQVSARRQGADTRLVQMHRNVSATMRKLQRKGLQEIASGYKMGMSNAVGRHKMDRRNSVKCTSLSSPLKKLMLCGDSWSYEDNGRLAKSSRINVSARLEVISSADYEGTDSGFDDLSTTDQIDVPFQNSLPQPSFHIAKEYEAGLDVVEQPGSYYRFIEKTPEELDNEIEYDVDEEDVAWLELLNEERCSNKCHKSCALSVELFEMVMDRFEKEAHYQGQDIVLGTSVSNRSADEDALCAVCSDDECTNTNAILFCDACNLSVHQECYGVPFVPEGQWLCRRCQCQHVDIVCCLCPVRGGALKQTNDGRWAHVICALWIPEVGFGSVELLEPITKLACIPAARFRLTCTVCAQSRAGACIQCMHKNCYKAFHITCAQQVGLYMKIEPLLDANGLMINVSKTLLCDNHKPVGARSFQPMIDNSIDNDGRPPAPARDRSRPLPRDARKKGRCFRKQRHDSDDLAGSATCDVPTIPSDSIDEIASSCLPMNDKYQLVRTLETYWLLKRQSRNGLPLLRGLNISAPDRYILPVKVSMQCVKKLRQEMEKVRLLLELIRKRERLKREMIRISEVVIQLELEPFYLHLRRTLNQLEALDTGGIFAQPVTADQTPGYFAVANEPMDFCTMRRKVECHAYKAFCEFENDFWHIVNNCRQYKPFYRLAVQLANHGKLVLDAASQATMDANYCVATGLHQTNNEVNMKCGIIDTKFNSTDDDGPPDLSRCPSPVTDYVSLPLSLSTIAGLSLNCADPPALTRSEPILDNNNLLEEQQVSYKTDPLQQ